MSIYERVKNNYVQDVDDHTLIKGAIDGMLNALDPHSSYAEEGDFDELSTLSNGNYAGIGVLTTVEDGAMKVVSTTEDTPAWRAGIKSGDFITRVDGKLVYGLSLDEGTERLRGTSGSRVELSVFRPGRAKPLKLTLVRDIIDVKPVKWEVKDGVGIVNLNRFTGNSAIEVGSALAAIERQTKGQAIGYVLDLRSNGGGVLEQAVEIADLFLNSGEIVSQRGRDTDDARHYYARPGDVTNGRPVLVLVDAGTASASEIVAGGAPGASPRAGRRRAQLRQGLGPVDLQPWPAPGAAPDHRALLSAVGAVGPGGRDRARHRHPAIVGRGLRLAP